jgi:hypothetical protein
MRYNLLRNRMLLGILYEDGKRILDINAHLLIKLEGRKMKKLIFLLFLFILTSPASASIYKWVDQQGTIYFADDLAKVPPDYRSSVEEVNAPRVGRSTLSQATVEKRPVTGQPGESAAEPPPIAQTLVREGDFAIKLAEVLKVGQAQSEAEAESTLASAGIAPKNGWIADYPVTPDIIGELQNVVGAAADSGKLAMKKDEAMKVFQDLVAQQGFPVRSDERQYAGIEQPDAGVAPLQNYPEYYEPSEINNYYYNQGPPIVTYYPPPQDYDYLYAWVPYPFWYGRFWFPGFFCLRDFHRDFFLNGHSRFVSNHFRDSRTRGFGTIDPARRHMGNSVANISHPSRGFTSSMARNGASSIARRSLGNASNRPPGGLSANRWMSVLSSPRARLSGSRLPTGYRAPSTGYPASRSMSSGRSAYGSGSFKGSFSHPGMGTARSFSPSVRSGSSGFRSGGFGGSGSFGGSRGGGGHSFGGFSGGHSSGGFFGGGQVGGGGHR